MYTHYYLDMKSVLFDRNFKKCLWQVIVVFLPNLMSFAFSTCYLTGSNTVRLLYKRMLPKVKFNYEKETSSFLVT